MTTAKSVSPPTDIPQTTAGVSSVRQFVSHEPSFARKRRVCDGTGGIISEGILQHGEDSAVKKNPALLYRAGHRRPLPRPGPTTEYQLQFTWKSGAHSEGPVLSAERLMNIGGARERRGRDGEGERREEREGKGRGGEGGGVKGGKGRGGDGGDEGKAEKGRMRGSKGGGGGKGRGDVAEGGMVRVRDEGGGDKVNGRVKKMRENPLVGPLTNGHLSSQKPPGPHNSTSVKGDGSAGHDGVKAPSKSPPQESQRHCHPTTSKRRSSRKKADIPPLGRSEYRTQFKAWSLPSGPLSNTHWKKQQHIHSPRKKSDITDHRLVTPPLLLPDSLPGPLQSGLWGTEYSTRYKNPLNFQYIRGAWMETPHPSPTPTHGNEVKLGEEPNQNTPSDDQQPEREEGGDEPVHPEESLLAQLSEIRQKAVEYRQRSEGCHFVPAHTSWRPSSGPDDEHSNSPSTSSSLSRSSSVSSLSEDEHTNQNQVQPHAAHNGHPSHHHKSHSHHITNGDVHIEDMEEGEGEGERGESGDSDTESESDKNPHHTLCTQQPENSPPGVHSVGKISRPPCSTSAADPCDRGRVSTPVLHDNPEEMRHHLDRTTPSSGAILTSPPLPAFLKQSKTTASCTAGGGARGPVRRGGVGGIRQSSVNVRSVSSSRVTGCSQRQGKNVMFKSEKTGLHLSQRNPKLKRDPSLVSSGLHSSSHHHTLPKSTKSHQPPKSQRTSLSTHASTAHQPLTRPRPPSPPPSTVSSLLSSDLSSTGAARKLDYGTNGFMKSTQSSHSSKPWPAHTHSGCTSTQCDVCGAWLRKMHTSTQVSNLSQEPCPASRAHRYKGPVTCLSQPESHLPSQAGNRPTLGGEHANLYTEPQPRGAAFSVPPQTLSPPLREVDDLSVSTLSLSSCSVASDLLKKARERRERFWTQPPPHTTS